MIFFINAYDLWSDFNIFSALVSQQTPLRIRSRNSPCYVLIERGISRWPAIVLIYTPAPHIIQPLSSLPFPPSINRKRGSLLGKSDPLCPYKGKQRKRTFRSGYTDNRDTDGVCLRPG